ncbi:hypothetical protein [Sulfuricurvum sp.]|uniref:hypothetical protein n=1 Tax=Sulfuricurvum sp. TaxID=2025608 RepID=UPI0026319840|nr:hypothetical protein [Sulfuricurvum sp.]MDD3597441.1 hypothetical protein [Sulfuricurvum sp.]
MSEQTDPLQEGIEQKPKKGGRPRVPESQKKGKNPVPSYYADDEVSIVEAAAARYMMSKGKFQKWITMRFIAGDLIEKQ